VKRTRLAVWLILAVVGIATLVFATVAESGPATEAERVQSLTETYACPECDGQSVAESNAAVASTIRDFIRVEVNLGSTDEAIRDRLIAAYGTDVLLTPPADGISSLIWVLPVVVVAMGAGGVVMVLRRGRSRSRTASVDDLELVKQARAEDNDR
jgi:cytochrome c-type biogenesis protein CcmH